MPTGFLGGMYHIKCGDCNFFEVCFTPVLNTQEKSSTQGERFYYVFAKGFCPI